MISLQEGALLALGKDDQSIKDFVELGKVEEPAVKGKALVPYPPNIAAVRIATKQLDSLVGDTPLVARRVV